MKCPMCGNEFVILHFGLAICETCNFKFERMNEKEIRAYHRAQTTADYLKFYQEYKRSSTE